jgi:hypothetical protein
MRVVVADGLAVEDLTRLGEAAEGLVRSGLSGEELAATLPDTRATEAAAREIQRAAGSTRVAAVRL